MCHHCRVSQGLGVFYMGDRVLPPRTFVQRYVGELCCAWRWAEKTEKVRPLTMTVLTMTMLTIWHHVITGTSCCTDGIHETAPHAHGQHA